MEHSTLVNIAALVGIIVLCWLGYEWVGLVLSYM